MKLLIATLLVLTLVPGLAAAGAEFHLDLNANGETHTVDVIVGDDGSATILVDGQPVGAPALP